MNVFVEDILKERKEHIKEIQENRTNVFQLVGELFELISNKPKNIDNEITKILDKDKDNNISFIVWILIHYSCYNKYTRKMIDLISKTSYSLNNKEFIYWYIKFCIHNGFTFPKFMYFYKFSVNNNKKYKEYILENFDMSEDEYEDTKNYFNISDKDMYYIYKNIKKENKI